MVLEKEEVVHMDRTCEKKSIAKSQGEKEQATYKKNEGWLNLSHLV